VNKTQQVVEHLKKGDLKDALKIARTFRMGYTPEERATVTRGYECLVHPKFYQALGMNCTEAVQKARECLTTKYQDVL
jgi:hypothetical protein